MPVESAESRPIIIKWLSKMMVFFALLLLMASCITLYSSIRQVAQTSEFSAVKPAGDIYSVQDFEDSGKAQAEAQRIWLESSQRK